MCHRAVAAILLSGLSGSSILSIKFYRLSAEEVRDENDGLPASTANVLNEHFSNFLAVQNVRINQGGKMKFSDLFSC